jgi:hypothetical protein
MMMGLGRSQIVCDCCWLSAFALQNSCAISNYSPSDLKITLIIGFFHTNQHDLDQFPDCWIVASADTKRDSAFITTHFMHVLPDGHHTAEAFSPKEHEDLNVIVKLFLTATTILSVQKFA